MLELLRCGASSYHGLLLAKDLGYKKIEVDIDDLELARIEMEVICCKGLFLFCKRIEM